MGDYNKITLKRFMRVIVRQCVTLRDIGFTTKAIDAFLDIAVEEAVRLAVE